MTAGIADLKVDQAVLSRRGWTAAGLTGVMALALGRVQAAAVVQLPVSVSLPDELKAALALKRPLVVMVSLDGCPYCKMARQSFLGPMYQREGLQVVQVDMRSTRLSKDFTGVQATHDELIRRWSVKVAPTLLFFGPEGGEVASRMVGGYLPDFYGAYLDERLQTAQRSF
jgi:thioredoxin-related protein